MTSCDPPIAPPLSQPSQVSARHISGALEGPAPAEDAERAVLRLADELRRSSWKELAGGVECAPGSALTALVAARLPPSVRLQA